jgi:hypothetical protein
VEEQMALAPETIADAMYEMVAESAGKKSLKPADLVKAMVARFGEAECSKAAGKQALRLLIDSGRCVYSYFGESFVTLPHKEGAEP